MGRKKPPIFHWRYKVTSSSSSIHKYQSGEAHLKIVVVGSIAYDAVETPAGKRESQLGGSACFFSTSASYFTEVGIIGVVGNDFAPSDRSML